MIQSRSAHERSFGLWSACLMIGMVAAMFVMLGRVAQLQLRTPADLQAQRDPRVTRKVELAVRGDVMDVRGRLLSATRFGYRAIVDPTQLRDTIHQDIPRLAVALGQDSSQLGDRILSRVVENQRRAKMREAAERAGSVVQGPAGLFERLSRAVGDAMSSTQPAPAVPPGEGGQGEDASKPDPEPKEIPRGIEPHPMVKSLGAIRYLPVSEILTDEQVGAVRELKIRGVMLERVMVREYPGGESTQSIVGFVGFGHTGLLGAEKTLEKELRGTPGSISYVRDAKGRPLWIEPGQIAAATPGRDIRLSIDTEMQRMLHEELTRGVEEANAAGGRAIIMDPLTGEILAMVDELRDVPDAVPYPWAKVRSPKDKSPDPSRPPPPARYITIHRDPSREQHPAERRNRCVEDVYEPGSTFKPFIWSVITELGKATPSEVFDTEGGRWHTSYGRYIEDVTKRATMTWSEVLINSSNIGMVKAGERISYKQMSDGVRKFGFGSRTNIGLPGETGGLVTPFSKWGKYTQTSVAYGHEIAVTPVQMVRAFSVFARPGELAGTMPPLRLSAATAEDVQGSVIRRVIPASVARLAREAMKNVATNVENRMVEQKKDEGVVWKYHIFGKSGTAEIPLGKAPSKDLRRPRGTSGYFDNQYNSSFIAGGPLEDPRLVCLVVIDDPGPEMVRKRLHYGATVAGPVARRTLERALTYLGIAPSPITTVPPEMTASDSSPGTGRGNPARVAQGSR